MTEKSTDTPAPTESTGSVGRPMFIGPDDMAEDYDAATAADKHFAYTPAPGGGTYPDGAAPFVVGKEAQTSKVPR